MEIKEAILQDEINKIKEFLLNFDLKFEDSTQLTIYAEEDSQIVGTVSASGNLIKQLAVSNSMQGEDLASKLISQMLSTLAASSPPHAVMDASIADDKSNAKTFFFIFILPKNVLSFD